MTEGGGIVLSAFDSLLIRASDGAVPTAGYVVEHFDASKDFLYLGCAENGELAFVVSTLISRVPPRPLRLAALSADFGLNCELNDGSAPRSVRVSVLRCTGTEQSTRELFATVCGALAESLSRPPSELEFAELITQWSNLFWRIGQHVETDIVGLAGELVVLRQSQNIDDWLDAWHAQPTDTLDFEFVASRASVEVKTTRGAQRKHPVSMEQVAEPRLSSRFFASVLVELNDSGELLGEVVRDIADRLRSDTSRLRLWDILTKTCGEGLSGFLSRRLDLEKAVRSLAFFRAQDIPLPLVIQPIPAGVSAIKFTSDFSLADEVSSTDVDAAVMLGAGEH
jgi:hypothetical protein